MNVNNDVCVRIVEICKGTCSDVTAYPFPRSTHTHTLTPAMHFSPPTPFTLPILPPSHPKCSLPSRNPPPPHVLTHTLRYARYKSTLKSIHGNKYLFLFVPGTIRRFLCGEKEEREQKRWRRWWRWLKLSPHWSASCLRVLWLADQEARGKSSYWAAARGKCFFTVLDVPRPGFCLSYGVSKRSVSIRWLNWGIQT